MMSICKVIAKPVAVSLLFLAVLGLQVPASAQPELVVAVSLDIPPYVIDKAAGGLEVDILRSALEGDSFCDLPQCNEVPPQAVTCPRCLEIIADCVEYAKQEGQTDGND